MLMIVMSNQAMSANYRLYGEWESINNTWTVLHFETDGVEDYAKFENLTFDDVGVSATVNGIDQHVYWGNVSEDIPIWYYSDVYNKIYEGEVVANYETISNGLYVMNLNEVPIPAAIWLFMGGIGLLGFKSR